MHTPTRTRVFPRCRSASERAARATDDGLTSTIGDLRLMDGPGPDRFLSLETEAGRKRPESRARFPPKLHSPKGRSAPQHWRASPAWADPNHGGGNPNGHRTTSRVPLPRGRDSTTSRTPPPCPIRLADLYPLLAQAYRDNYVWLRDFEEDQILVSRDLYEVVRAFSDCRPSA